MTITEIAEAIGHLERWARAQRPPMTPTWDLFVGIRNVDDVRAELDRQHNGAPGADRLHERLVALRGRLVRATL